MTTVQNLFPDTFNISQSRSGSFSQKHVLMLKGYLGMWKIMHYFRRPWASEEGGGKTGLTQWKMLEVDTFPSDSKLKCYKFAIFFNFGSILRVSWPHCLWFSTLNKRSVATPLQNISWPNLNPLGPCWTEISAIPSVLYTVVRPWLHCALACPPGLKVTVTHTLACGAARLRGGVGNVTPGGGGDGDDYETRLLGCPAHYETIRMASSSTGGVGSVSRQMDGAPNCEVMRASSRWLA